jgi:hypothetical protein
MDAGEVRDVGTHADLLARDALYRELAATQLLTVDVDGNGHGTRLIGVETLEPKAVN